MTHRPLSRSSFPFLAVALAAAAVACGSGSDGDAPGSSSQAGAGGSTNPDGKTCSGPSDCPSGYVCTPKTLSAPFPSGPCTLEQCDALCDGDPDCISDCLAAPSCPTGGTGGAAGAAGSTGSGPCGSLCAKVAQACGPADGAACMGACPALPAACVSCIAGAADVCNPEAQCQSVCGTSQGTGGAGGGTSGSVCKPAPSSTGGSGGGGGSGPQPIAWAGTWTADLTYDVSCDLGLGNVKKASHMHTVTLHLAGANASLSATLDGGYDLSGTGGDTSMTLNGTFPFRDYGGETASGTVTKDNQGTVKITTVSSDKAASGALSGTFVGKFGASCTVAGGSIALSR